MIKVITFALINYPNNQQDFSAFITFSSQGSSCPSPTYLLISISAFFSEKIPSYVAARLTGYQIFVISSLPPPPPLFATIWYYSSLFETIRHYSRLFASIRLYSYYSLFATVRYSLFGFSRHPHYM